MLRNLTPIEVVAVDTRTDDVGPFVRASDRALLAERTVASRVEEFVIGRACARLALSRLGQPGEHIGRGERHQPLWPPGIVGSITHCDGFVAAAVGRSSHVFGVGIDAEPASPLPDDVCKLAMSDHERLRFEQLPVEPALPWSTVAFSAKESIYKLWYPKMATWLDFDEAEVSLVPSSEPAVGTFTAVVSPKNEQRPPQELTTIRGRFAIDDGLVVTAVSAPASYSQ